MRLIILFDLPTHTREQRKHHAKFRKYLLQNGFTMLQFSIYGRVCRGLEGLKACVERVKKVLPATGNVRAMKVTEKQYVGMEILLGTQRQEEKDAGEQLLLL